MENAITLIVAILAFISSVASLIITIVNERNRVKTDVVTKNRIDWIKDVRSLMMQFLEIYIEDNYNGDKRKKKLMIISSKINLYFREGVKSYALLTKILNKCANNNYNDEDLELLIEIAQIAFSDVWVRTKREAGIEKKEDNRYEKLFGNKLS